MFTQCTGPYPAHRQPVFARNVVSISHPLAAQAGLRMQRQGGNAVDAAVAAAAVLTVCEPVSNGLGGDAFCMLWDGRGLHAPNAAGRAPAVCTQAYFRSKWPLAWWARTCSRKASRWCACWTLATTRSLPATRRAER